MPNDLLATKLYRPQVRGGSVPRVRLVQRIDRAALGGLTLVSAPAGFGKTTLLAQWLESRPTGAPPVAWVSLDESDNDPGSFWTYVIAALRSVAPAVGVSELTLLQAPDRPPIQRLLTTLLNDLASLSHDIVVVLDDYHVIDALEVHEAMAFLLDHAPPCVHVVVATRADPALPLARLRARGELIELRVADLRFTPDEAATYLNEAMGLDLSTQQVATLEGRTEGWIAALQLAALSLSGRDDVASFIGAFAGDDRFVVDYLVEEVLHRQEADVQAFLLQTSILDRLTGPLCDAVTGQTGGKARLAALDRANLFLVPLDNRRGWYRYHHLFADLLRARLLDEQPHDVPRLHTRASVWYERNGYPAEAIHHAIAGGDLDRAADLMELMVPSVRRERREATMLSWLKLLPDDKIELRPVLSVAYAGVLLSTGAVEGVERRLRDVERWLAPTPPALGGAPRAPAAIVMDAEEFRRLPGWVALYRAAHRLALGDTYGTVAHAQRALSLLEPSDEVGQAAAEALLGLASWAGGHLDAAYEAYARCQATFERLGYLSDVLGCAITLADIRVTQGRLRDAIRIFERALMIAAAPDGSALRGTADMYVGLSGLHREHNDLDAARRLLAESEQLGEHLGLPQNRYRQRVAAARLREADGDPFGAITLLDEAERCYAGDFSPDVRPVSALRARVWVTMGRFVEAFEWASERGLSANDDLTYVREFEHVTLARALLGRYAAEHAEDDFARATGLLTRLLRAAEDGGRAGTVIEVLVLLALSLALSGDTSAALRPLERALTLGEPEGYVRVFLDEGPPMVGLLDAAAARGIAPGYVEALRNAARDGRAFTSASTAAPEPSAVAGTVVEPLSEREREVLRLLTTDLAGPDIARRLVVSLNTVRTHTKNIYAKLGVNNRRAAVSRAHELGLLPGRPRRP